MTSLPRVLLGVAALAVLGVVVVIAASWAPDVPVDSLKPRWAPPPSTFLAVDGMQVHLRDEGPRDDSVPVVLLHGTSSSLHTWDGWADSLKATHRVIRFDLPSFGLTGPSPEGDYRIEAYVAFVEHVLDALHVQRVVLGGNSLGGWIAWRMAAMHPARVQRLVLVDAAGYPFKATSEPIGFRLARMPVVKHLVGQILPRSVVASSVRNVFGDPSKVTPALVDRYFDLTRRAGNRAALVARFAQLRFDADTALVRSIGQPTLVIWGGRDRLIPPDNARRFVRDIVGSRLVMFDGLGHVPHEEDPAATFVVVRAFLADTTFNRR